MIVRHTFKGKPEVFVAQIHSYIIAHNRRRCSCVERGSTASKRNLTVASFSSYGDGGINERGCILLKECQKCSLYQLLLGGFKHLESFWWLYNLLRFLGFRPRRTKLVKEELVVSDFGQETMVVVYDAQEPSKVFIRLRQHLHFVWFELYAVKGDRIA